MALTHLKGLKITSSDGLIATAAAGVTIGTATITTGTLTTGNITTLSAGTLTATTKVIGAATWSGTRVIATGGSATISAVNVANGPIVVSPLFTATSGTGVRRRLATVVNRTASAFKVMLSSPSGTAMAGTVCWMVVNR